MRAILTKYLPPTNTRGSRVVAIDVGYGEVPRRLTVGWNDAQDPAGNHADACRAALHLWGWTGRWIGGSTREGYAFVCDPKAEARRLRRKTPATPFVVEV